MLQIILISLLSLCAFAQVDAPVNPVDFMQNPFHLEFRKIDTEHFEIIFPKEIESEAQRVAHLLEAAYPYVSRSQETFPPKISLVLQNQSTQSNGFVTLAPRRSEWYMTPTIDPELGSTEWLRTLSVHEFRHVVQFEKSKRGFNKLWYFVLGEIGQAIGVGLTMPPWYLEGDAVGIETALTKGGRGRLPIFERDLRTLLLSGKKFDYDKAHLGSYQDYIPSHYVWGYFYTTYLRNKHGDLALSYYANYAADMGWNPLSFYRAVDDLSGEKFETFYENTMKDLIHQWGEKMAKLSPTPYEVKSADKTMGWTNYYYPQVLDDGSVVSLKSGLSFIPQFVLTKDKKEKTLFYPARLMNEYPYKIRNNRMAFIEHELDPRWGYRDFSRLKVYDLKEDDFVLDKRKTKYRLAVLNPQGSLILASEWNEKQDQFIVVIDLDGVEKKKQEFPRGDVITSMDWLNEDEIILVIRSLEGKKSLEKYSLKDHSRQVLVPPSHTNLGFATVQDGHIFYESPESGIDNIYLFQSEGSRQVTSALFGSYAPHLKGDELTYSDYTAEGMNVVKKTLRWDEEQKSSDSFIPFYEKFAQSEKYTELESDLLKAHHYTSEKYSQASHAINPHSWLIFAFPLSPVVIAEVFSRDILNKFSTSVGAQVNLNEGTTTGFVTAAWSHLYSVVDLKGSFGQRYQTTTIHGRKTADRWEEGIADLGLQVPWQALTGRFNQVFSVRGFGRVIKITKSTSREHTNGMLSPGADINYSILSRTARRDIYPQLGYAVLSRFERGRDISGGTQAGSFGSIDNRLYLPGAMKHHSFYQQFAYERQNDNTYQYASLVFYPRGTRNIFLQEFNKYSANYTMPLFYPDLHWSRYIYLKRVFANLFYDQLNGRYGNSTYRAASYGWEVLFETNLARIFLPITLGVRGSYILQGLEQTQNYEIFLGQVLGVF
jgi:hypothetical protein